VEDSELGGEVLLLDLAEDEDEDDDVGEVWSGMQNACAMLIGMPDHDDDGDDGDDCSCRLWPTPTILLLDVINIVSVTVIIPTAIITNRSRCDDVNNDDDDDDNLTRRLLLLLFLILLLLLVLLLPVLLNRHGLDVADGVFLVGGDSDDIFLFALISCV